MSQQLLLQLHKVRHQATEAVAELTQAAWAASTDRPTDAWQQSSHSRSSQPTDQLLGNHLAIEESPLEATVATASPQQVPVGASQERPRPHQEKRLQLASLAGSLLSLKWIAGPSE